MDSNAGDQYALNWSNHTIHVKNAFGTLFADKEFVDVTLSCEGKKVAAHKVVLSACSSYFHDLFRDNPCQHPIIILKDVKYEILTDVLKFVYSGEVNVKSENLDLFLKTAELLQISGLTENIHLKKGKQTTSNDAESCKKTLLNSSSSLKRKLDREVDKNEPNKKQTTALITCSDTNNTEYQAAQEVDIACIKSELIEYVNEDCEDLQEDPLQQDYEVETADDITELDSKTPRKYIMY